MTLVGRRVRLKTRAAGWKVLTVGKVIGDGVGGTDVGSIVKEVGFFPKCEGKLWKLCGTGCLSDCYWRIALRKLGMKAEKLILVAIAVVQERDEFRLRLE